MLAQGHRALNCPLRQHVAFLAHATCARETEAEVATAGAHGGGGSGGGSGSSRGGGGSRIWLGVILAIILLLWLL